MDHSSMGPDGSAELSQDNFYQLLDCSTLGYPHNMGITRVLWSWSVYFLSSELEMHFRRVTLSLKELCPLLWRHSLFEPMFNSWRPRKLWNLLRPCPWFPPSKIILFVVFDTKQTQNADTKEVYWWSRVAGHLGPAVGLKTLSIHVCVCPHFGM